MTTETNIVTQRIRVEQSVMHHGNANLYFLDEDGVQFMRVCVAGHIADRMLEPSGHSRRKVAKI